MGELLSYARQCVEHRVTVRGRDSTRTDHPDGRRIYMWQRDECENFRVISQREQHLRNMIDAAIERGAS